MDMTGTGRWRTSRRNAFFATSAAATATIGDAFADSALVKPNSPPLSTAAVAVAKVADPVVGAVAVEDVEAAATAGFAPAAIAVVGGK